MKERDAAFFSRRADILGRAYKIYSRFSPCPEDLSPGLHEAMFYDAFITTEAELRQYTKLLEEYK